MENDHDVKIKMKSSEPPRKKRKYQKRRKNNEDDDEYNENRLMAQNITNRFKNKKAKDEVPKFVFSYGSLEFKNPESHNKTIARAVEVNLSRISQWEEQQDSIETPYVCSFCQIGVLQGDMGELFGPYYLELDPVHNWPSFFGKKPHEKHKVKVDIWVHGECALNAPGIFLAGNQLENLNLLEKYWKQHCEVCKQVGATIAIENRKRAYAHYRCAKSKRL